MQIDDKAVAREWLIKKDGYFYRPNRCGYTTSKFEAGRYTEEEAKAEADVEPWHMRAFHQDEVPDDGPSKSIASKDAEIERLTRELAEAREALEFYRDGFRYHARRSKTGINLSIWLPTEALLDDCGERARAALAQQEGQAE